MNNQLKAHFLEGIAAGLKRRTLTKCSKWAQACVVMGKPFPGPLNFRHHPWSKDMHDSEATWTVGQKAAQMGYSTVLLHRTLYEIDVKRQNCLYLLPTKTPDATDFTVTRFDPALELSPYLKNLFSDVNNVSVKRAGSANLYVRGANSRSGLKSIPVAFIVFDEYDEMPEEMIELAKERTSGQLEKNFWAISTPTVPGKKINRIFLDSTQEHWCFECPCCGRQTKLIFPDSLVVCGDDIADPDVARSHIICIECKGVLRHEEKPNFLGRGEWVPTNHRDFKACRGFYINQLYSPTISPAEFALHVIRARTNLWAEQELYNSKAGLPHLVAGAKVDDSEIIKCINPSRRKTDKLPGDAKVVTMGIDVGKWLHFEIAMWAVKRFGNDINVMADCHVLMEGKVLNFEDLDKLMREWQVQAAVIDWQPESRKALEFAKRFYPRVKLCRYGKNIINKDIEVSNDTYYVTVDRTTWLDMSLGRFHNQTIWLPVDVSTEYREHIQAPARLYKTDRDGNPIGVYEEQGAADHFAHARNYNEIALPMAAAVLTNSDIKRFL